MATTGQIFGKYSLIMKLAVGGQGEIYLARREGAAGFEKQVVIKRLLPHLAEEEHFAKMLMDEARIVARLDHVNVCQVHELDKVSGAYYLAMEYLEGVPLSSILQQAANEGRTLDIRLVSAILQQACEGLHHAHELKDADGELIGLVHRDVSPSNLFVTVDGYVKVLDFGVAKARGMESHTRTGTIKGKYEYMSPEQVLRRELDRRSDIFSLGIVLYEALTVRRMFYRESEFEVFRAITDDPLPSLRLYRPDAPDELVAVFERALSRDVETRFATARDLRLALMDATASLGPPYREEEISQYVRTHFEDEIASRHEAITVRTARMERRSSQSADDWVAFSPARRSAATETLSSADSVDIGFEETAMHQTPMTELEPAPHFTRRPIFWMLLVVLAMAVGTVAAVIVRGRQVERAAQAQAVANVDEAPRPRDPCTAPLSARRNDVVACFNTHAPGNKQTKWEVDVVFDLNGHVKDAQLVPADLNDQVKDAQLVPAGKTNPALNQCVKDIAMQADFSECTAITEKTDFYPCTIWLLKDPEVDDTMQCAKRGLPLRVTPGT